MNLRYRTTRKDLMPFACDEEEESVVTQADVLSFDRITKTDFVAKSEKKHDAQILSLLSEAQKKNYLSMKS